MNKILNWLAPLSMVCTAIPSYAYEADYFSRRTGYNDSAYILNQKMNETLYTIASNSKSCNEGDLHRDLIGSMGGAVIASIETWNSQVPGNFKPTMVASIYSGLDFEAPFLFMGCCATIMKVGDTLISGDKLGHFLQSGFEMYYVVRSKSAEPINDARSLFTRFVGYMWESAISGPEIDRVIGELGLQNTVLSEQEMLRIGPSIAGRVSQVQESHSFGAASTGVFSYGDIAANFGGYLFWSNLTRGPNPYFRCEMGKWKLQREFDWRDYVTDAWDEAINCSEFSTPKMRQTIAQRVEVLARRNNWPSTTCPVVPDKCKDLASYYGEASQWILHPDCQNSAPTVTPMTWALPTPLRMVR